jgi:hypothetical protein
MNAWNEFCNVLFTEIPAGASLWSAQVRITRDFRDDAKGITGGHWSWLGTDILNHPGQPTMNLQGFDLTTDDAEYRRVVRHETGHTLGFTHEHFHKEIVEWIDPDKAIEYFAGFPNNWPPEVTRLNVLKPLSPRDLIASATVDVHSIMCYDLPPSIMKPDAPTFAGGRDFTNHDKKFAESVYPKLASIPAWDAVNDVPDFGEPIGTNANGLIVNTDTFPVATETVDIVTSGGHVYQLGVYGSIWRYTFVAAAGSPTPAHPITWVQVSDANGGATVQIVADDQRLYKRLNTGAIFLMNGTKNDSAFTFLLWTPLFSLCS